MVTVLFVNVDLDDYIRAVLYLQVVDVVSCLAVQRPVDVTVKLVDTAVQSRGHIECIVELLRRLPTLAAVTASDGRRCSLLLDRLSQQIVSSTLQLQNMQNIHCFSRLLLVCAIIYLHTYIHVY